MTSFNPQAFVAYAAAIEAIEPGASRHCAQALFDDDDRHIGYAHFRLGVRVTVAPEDGAL